MHTEVMKWVSVTALLLAVVFWRSASNCHAGLWFPLTPYGAGVSALVAAGAMVLMLHASAVPLFGLPTWRNRKLATNE